ncbi:MAG: hypothetical protein GX591_11815 [Planctomycetes bacterium]|nr:hypothetical protein [Planctomycetota bacterium]
MTRLVFKLLLSVIALPLAVVVFFLAMTVADALGLFRWYGGTRPLISELAQSVPVGLAALTVAVLWTLVWRRRIGWTSWRRVATVLVMMGCLAMPVASAVLQYNGAHGDLPFLVTGLYVLLVPVLLAWIWRSSRREEAERLDAWLAAPTPQCPYCQANLTGRWAPQCPYCGGDLAARASAGANA